MSTERETRDCPNRPEWAAPVPAISPEGFCYHCSKVVGEWVPCQAALPAVLRESE